MRRAPAGSAGALSFKETNLKRHLASLFVLAALGFAAATAPAFADADDAKWIAKCVSDNADQGATAEVVTAYCACMNSKMSSNETLSITAWEKTHTAERDACSKQAGWK